MPLTTLFVGIDDDAVGQGDDDETLTVDTWLQRRIQANNERLLAVRAANCFSPISGSADDFTSYAGVRPYCAFRYHTHWRGVLPVFRDQTHIRVTYLYQVDAPGAGGLGSGEVKVKIWAKPVGGSGSETALGETLANTYSGGVVTGHQSVTLRLAARAQQNGLIGVTLATRHDTVTGVNNGTTVGDNADGSTTFLFHEEPYVLFDDAANIFDPNSAGTPPDADSREVMYLEPGTYTNWPAANTDPFDMLYTGDRTGDDFAGTLQPVVRAASAVQESGQLFVHNCMFLRAIMFEPVFGSQTVGSEYASSAFVDPKKLAPNVEFGSAEAMAQVEQVRRAYFMPTLALGGPQGRLGDTSFSESDLDAFAANGYAVHWPTIRGNYDDATTGEHTDVINEGLYLRTLNPRIELRCTWLSIQHNATWDANQARAAESVKQTESNDGKLDKVDVYESSGPGRARWDMFARVQQINDTGGGGGVGDWDVDVTTYGSLTEENIIIPVYGGDVVRGDSSQPPVLRGTDSMEQVGKGDTTQPGFWFKEGSLFQEDLGVLYTTSHEFLLSNMTQTEQLRPFRLKVNMTLDNFDDPLRPGPTAGVTPDDELRLTLVSFTVIEHPQDPATA